MQRKKTDYIVVHCSATTTSMDIGAEEIRYWHKARGWKDIGYHLIIRRDGSLEIGRALNSVGAHVYGHNHCSVGICVVGGIDDDGKDENNFTEAQFTTLRSIIDEMQTRYPGAQLMGHRDFPEVAKDCPCFDVRGWYGQHG
jgi:N-acetyl-anhydromuramyl-L-alanine amidase AmpD